MLTWLLAAAANRDFDLVFKGGTCLRRCYFEGYRYSEDLDFTRRPAASLLAIVDAAAAWCEWIAAEAGIRAEPIADETFGDRRAWVSFTGPLGASRQRAIKIDMANDEEILDPSQSRPLLSEYSDLTTGRFSVNSYSLHEIWSEKTRALMQRAEPRDLYDLATIARANSLLPAEARPLFEAKARAKGLEPSDLGDRLTQREPTLRRRWSERLHDQVGVVPEFDVTWRLVRRTFRQAGYLE